MSAEGLGRLGWATSIPAHWDVVPLKHVAKMGTGHTPDRNKPAYWRDCDIPWVTTPDVTRRAESLEPLVDTEQKISQVGLANSAAVLHPTDTVMLSRTASIGYSVRIGRPMATTQAFVTWTPGPMLDPRYLLLVLRAMRQEWERLAYGSTHLTIYMPDLESIRIPLPPLAEQRRIADFLDVESARIGELAKLDARLLTSLYERRQSVIDLEIESARNSRQPVKLFWQLALLRDGSHQPPPRVVSGVPFLTARNISSGVLKLTDQDTAVSEEDASEMERSLRLRSGDVLLSVKGTVGACAVTPSQFPRVVLDRNIALLRPRRGYSSDWLACALRSTWLQDQIRIAVTAAAQPGLSLGAIRELRVPDVDQEDQHTQAEQIANQCSQVDQVIRRVRERTALLVERRQALITAAVTGQIDVSTASGRGIEG